ncbi:hypothetical protein F5Y10DRAFT_229938, partial [Nemania abortiva]
MHCSGLIKHSSGRVASTWLPMALLFAYTNLQPAGIVTQLNSSLAESQLGVNATTDIIDGPSSRLQPQIFYNTDPRMTWTGYIGQFASN